MKKFDPKKEMEDLLKAEAHDREIRELFTHDHAMLLLIQFTCPECNKLVRMEVSSGPGGMQKTSVSRS